MHARVTSVTIQHDKIDESIRIYREDIGPVISAQKGCKGADLLIDRKTGEGLSITMWDNEADALAYEKSGTYKAQVDKLRQYFATPPTLRNYTVGVQVKAPARVTS